MQLRFPVQRALALAASMALLAPGSAALAAEQGGWHDGSWHGDSWRPDAREDSVPRPSQNDGAGAYRQGPDDRGEGHRDGHGEDDFRRDDRWRHSQRAQFDPVGREAWLVDCRQGVASRDRGLGGAVIGGAVGGLAGNRIAGRGNRVVGTVAGAAVGAVAGSAIDRAEDRSRARDECEAYLDDYYARYSGGGYDDAARGYAQAPAYGAYTGVGCCGGAPVMMVPIAQTEPECTETVEYIYEDVPVRRKTYRPAPAKRIRIAPDKRVRVVPDKRISTK